MNMKISDQKTVWPKASTKYSPYLSALRLSLLTASVLLLSLSASACSSSSGSTEPQPPDQPEPQPPDPQSPEEGKFHIYSDAVARTDFDDQPTNAFTYAGRLENRSDGGALGTLGYQRVTHTGSTGIAWRGIDVDLSAYQSVRFSYRVPVGSSASSLEIEIRSVGSGECDRETVPLTADNAWHEVILPLTDFSDSETSGFFCSAPVDFTRVETALQYYLGSNGDVVDIDEVYYDIRPVGVSPQPQSPEPQSDDHGGTILTATDLSLDSPQSGEIETGSDVDYFKVAVAVTGTLTIYTTGSLDSVGTLEDSSGSQLAENDDGGTGTNFRIVQSVTAGTYYIRVGSYSSDTGNYTLHADFTAASDLIVLPPSVTDATLTTGQSFTLSAMVRNHGAGSAAGTTLTWYRSLNATIDSSDIQVGTDSISSLSAGSTSAQDISLTAPATADTYYYGACVTSVSGESNTGNNCSTGVMVTVRSLPSDLIVLPPSVTDATLTTGQSFTLRATVRNQGTGSAAGTTLTWYRSLNTTIDSSDILVGTDPVGGLSASGTSFESISLTAPTTAGTYYYGACVTSVSGESNTGNNCSTGVSVTVRTPSDLVVISPSVTDATLTTGQSFTLRATVRNQGGVSTGSTTTLRYYRSLNATIDSSDTRVGTDSVSSLFAGSSGTENISLTAPTTVGTYYYGACVDTVSGESNTSNNCSTGVMVTVRSLPSDLIVLPPSVNDATLTTGQSFTLRATVRNQGGVSTGSATTLRWYRSTDSTIDSSDSEVGTDSISSLSSGNTSAQNISLTAPTTGGTYYYGACVATVSGESNTGNNCSTGVMVTVSASPDLIVISPSVTNATLYTGQSFTLRATVRNQGGVSAGSATTLRWYRSTDSTIDSSDSEVGTDSISSLSSGNTSAQDISLTAPATTGTYYYGACVASVSGEFNTGNNCSTGVSVTVRTPSDLIVISPSVTDATLTTGQSFTLRATVRNRGGVSTGSTTTLRYYRSLNATIDSSDTEVGTDSISSLSAGSTSAQDISLTAPATTGTYYYGACVASVSGESNTGNNCSTGVSVTVRTPSDLVVISPSVTDATLYTGQSFTLRATVRNRGGVSTGSTTTLRYYRSLNATISSSDTEVGTDSISSLSAGSTSAQNISLTAPATTGTYYYGACVASVSGESNTGNNCSTGVSVTVRTPSDLVVISPSVTDATLYTGQSFTLRARVRNQGTGSAAGTTLTWYRSLNTTIDSSDILVGTDPVGGLSASGTSFESISLTAPTTAGTYYYGACVATVSGESNTGNNCSTGVSVTVRAATDDHGNSRAAATDLILNSSQTGVIETGSDTDYFKVVATDPGTLTIYTTGSLDSVGTLEDSSGSQLASNDDGGTGTNFRIVQSVTAGTYYIRVDSHRSNTGSYTLHADFTTTSDLIVISPSVTDASLTAGQSFTLSATVRNQGTGSAAGTTLRYYRSTNATISSSDIEVGTDSISSLSAGSTSAQNISLTAPATTGTYYYGACVTSVSGESNTGNNCSTGVSVTVSLPSDLIVISPSVTDASLTAGQSFTLSATVRNQGTGSAAGTTLTWYRSLNAMIDSSDIEVGTDPVGGLSASGTSPESIDLTAPATTGTYYYGACVTSVSGESNTGNNCSTGVSVTVSTPSDLVVISPSVTDATLTTGQSFTLSATVRNRGGVSTGSTTTLRWYRSLNATIDSSDIEVGTDSISSLSASGTSPESISLTAPATTGTYYYGACVTSVSGESNTGNNCSTGVSVTVRSLPSDLVVISPSVTDVTLTTGQSFTLSAMVRNQGTGSAAGTTLTWYRSLNATIDSSDIEVGTDSVGSLSASGTSPESIDLTAPTTAGTYYYGACVDTVSGESNTGNNCSTGVSVTVSPPPPFANGSGTEDEPYLISSLTDLNNIRGQYLDDHFRLTTDLDLGVSPYNTGAGWLPIGNSSTRFTGSFDGDGFMISNLFINRPTEDYIGLFGYVASGGVVEDLGVEGVNIMGGRFVGGLVGRNNGGTVTNCSTTGSVTGTQTNLAGGLLGSNSGTVTNCYSTATVMGTNNVSSVGGLVGGNLGTVMNSYATGTVTGTSHTVGGLVGSHEGGGTVENSYATGSVTGTHRVGGLAGQNYSTVTNCYATGRPSGISRVGGLVGASEGGGTVENSYATGSVTGTHRVGGLAGQNLSGSTVRNSYWNTTTSGRSIGIGLQQGTATNVTGLTTAQMYERSSFETPSDGDDTNDWDFTTIWHPPSAANTHFPLLRGVGQQPPPPFAGGMGTSEAPFLISSLEELNAIRGDYLDDHFILMTDLDFASSSFQSGTGWLPIGHDEDAGTIGFQGTEFTGSFKGDGHVISNLFINRPTEGFIGLFGQIGTGGEIENLGLEDVNITGSGYVGGLVGFSNGPVMNSYSTGSVSGTTNVGGLVGFNSRALSNSYSACVMSGTEGLGGLVGWNTGTMNNSYSTGQVSGTTQVGGLLGRNNSGRVNNSYSTGRVSGTTNVGGLVGRNDTNLGVNNYWNTETSGQGSRGVGSGSASGTTGLTTTAMYQQSNYHSSWDFTTIWHPPNAANTHFPLLRGVGTQPLFAGGNGSSGAPFQIATVEQLNNVRDHLTSHFILTADLDFASSSFQSGVGWQPIGHDEDAVMSDFQGTAFTGNFNGAGNVISNLFINRPTEGYIGLFGSVGSGGIVYDLGVENVNITGSDFVSALVGRNEGMVTNSYSTGTVTGGGDSVFGGLVGVNFGGTVSNSYSEAMVTGTRHVGGLVGSNNGGTVENSYSTGWVMGAMNIGGLVGLNHATSTTSNSYSTGQVSGTTNIGGLVGRNRSDGTNTVENSYWNTATSGQTTGIGLQESTATNVLGRATAAMYLRSSFETSDGDDTNDWDFTTIWHPPSAANTHFPLLRGVGTQPPSMGGGSTVPFSGLAAAITSVDEEVASGKHRVIILGSSGSATSVRILDENSALIRDSHYSDEDGVFEDDPLAYAKDIPCNDTENYTLQFFAGTPEGFPQGGQARKEVSFSPSCGETTLQFEVPSSTEGAATTPENTAATLGADRHRVVVMGNTQTSTSIQIFEEASFISTGYFDDSGHTQADGDFDTTPYIRDVPCDDTEDVEYAIDVFSNALSLGFPAVFVDNTSSETFMPACGESTVFTAAFRPILESDDTDIYNIFRNSPPDTSTLSAATTPANAAAALSADRHRVVITGNVSAETSIQIENTDFSNRGYIANSGHTQTDGDFDTTPYIRDVICDDTEDTEYAVFAFAGAPGGGFPANITPGDSFAPACGETTELSLSPGVTIDRTGGSRLPDLPDLVVESPAVEDTNLNLGETFVRLSATVRNQATFAAGFARLRYYQSTDATITTSDTEVGSTDGISDLAAGDTSDEFTFFTAPALAGIYFYGACVEVVSGGESNTANNCSTGVMVVVQ